MVSSLAKYLRRIRSAIALSPQRRLKYLERPFTDFTRDSPLTFPRMVALICGLMRKTTAIELHDFFERLKQLPVTKSAFCQRRKLIKPIFFFDLFKLSSTIFYKQFQYYKTWKNRLLLAVDGTGQTLPNEQWIGEAFGFHRNQHDEVPSTRILFTYDVLNSIIHRADFHTQKTGEITVAYPNVERLPKKAVYIYDRGFCGVGLPYLHRRYGSDCIIRMKIDKSPTIRDFVESNDPERFITIILRERALRSLRSLGLNPENNATVAVRLIRVNLPNGEVEVLMTTLLDTKKFPAAHFTHLYGLRWGVETSIHILKSFLQLALASAYTQPGVEQDLYASFLFFNLQSAIQFSVKNKILEISSRRKYSYQVNRNVTAGLIKRYMSAIFLDSNRRWANRIKELQKLFLKHLEPQRARPSRDRKKRMIRAQDRHVYEGNYRSAM